MCAYPPGGLSQQPTSLACKASLRRLFLLAPLCLSAAFLFFFSQAFGQDTPDYFDQNCKGCHTIGGGRLTGPDLKDVSKRAEREWLVKFLMDPKGVIDSGDPYAQKILEESRGVPMPTPPGITKARTEKLIDLIDAESLLEKSRFKGMKISMAPFTDAERAKGREIFLGPHRLKAGGSACISCHSMYDTPSLGGGRLGPDLTNIYERLKGRKQLSAWLQAPGTETMQPIFKNHPLAEDEIRALVAYFESTMAEKPADSSGGRVTFLLFGLVGAVVGVFFLDTIWKRRFQGVRRSLVEAHTTRGES